MNAVRIIDGTYVESGEPYLSPWVGAAGKYDTSQFEPKYFDRLKSFISEAGLRNIVVNLTLFSTMYGTGKGYGVWAQSPLFSAKVNWDRFNTLEDSALTAAQDALIRKTAAELNSLDNFYFTVCNDCKYSGATAKDTAAWVEHMTATVRDAESKLPNKHLIVDAMPQFRATGINAAPCKALEIRREAWVWMFANGGAYTTLDPSFTAQTPEGPSCKESRIQLGVLQNFLRQFNLIALKPDADAVRQWALGASDAWTLSDPGRTYAVYLRNPGTETRKSILLMDLPAGKWQIEWWNPRTGDQDKAEPVEHKGGSLRILTPGYTDDLAMKLTLQVPPPEPKEPSAKKTAAPVKKPAR